MRKLFVVKLNTADREALRAVTRRGGRTTRGAAAPAPPDAVRRAHLLLQADQGKEGPAWTDARICDAFGVSRATVERVRKRYLVDGQAAALARRRPPPRARKLDGHAEAHLIATACGAPPEGHKRWTLRLLAGRLIALEEVDSVSHETVRKVLKKTHSSPG